MDAETEAEGEDLGNIAVQFPDPIHLQGPDGVSYCIVDEGALCEALGVDSVTAYRATEFGLEWLTEKRRWEAVEAASAGPKAISKLKN